MHSKRNSIERFPWRSLKHTNSPHVALRVYMYAGNLLRALIPNYLAEDLYRHPQSVHSKMYSPKQSRPSKILLFMQTVKNMAVLLYYEMVIINIASCQPVSSLKNKHCNT